MLKKIAITGPESTGKSILSEQLASYFKTQWQEEHARSYIDKLDRPYNQQDILNIAQAQYQNYTDLIPKCDDLLIVDTELIVTKIWSEIKYNSCDLWILEHLKKQDFDLYLLCDIDLPWSPDPQREHPHMREHLFSMYKQNLEHYKFNYKIVSGKGSDRLMNAIQYINEMLEN